MSNTSLTLFDPANVPAHVSSFMHKESNITERGSVPSLSYKGKVWAISTGGETKRLTRTIDGDEQPATDRPAATARVSRLVHTATTYRSPGASDRDPGRRRRQFLPFAAGRKN